MLSSVRSRPNYYEMLGLTPAASEAQVNKAFAKTMSLLPPAGAAAQVCIAYETLRNPVRRRDYDLSLGLPAPLPQPRHLTIAVGQQHWAPFGTSVATPNATDVASRDEPHVTAARSSPVLERSRQASTASKGEPALREAHRPFEQEQQRSGNHPRLKAAVTSNQRPYRPAEPAFGNAESRSLGFNRTALLIGSAVLGVVVLGAWAGTVAGNDVGASQIVQTTTSAPSKALRAPLANTAQASVMPVPAEVEPATPRHSLVHNRQAKLSRASKQNISPAIAAPQSVEGTADGSTVAPSAPADAPVVAASADLRLPNKVIARTIDRIGYRCGEVASATAVEGAAGVFRVTCTSGRSFQARSVSGRYYFRRLG